MNRLQPGCDPAFALKDCAGSGQSAAVAGLDVQGR